MATADYVFVIEPFRGKAQATGAMQGLTASTLDPGLPRRGVCGSDHLSLMTEIAVSGPTSDT